MLNREKSALYGDLERILLGRDEIAARVEELGAEITRDYAGKTPVCIGILKGATPFYCDLIRCIDLKLTMDFMPRPAMAARRNPPAWCACSRISTMTCSAAM